MEDWGDSWAYHRLKAIKWSGILLHWKRWNAKIRELSGRNVETCKNASRSNCGNVDNTNKGSKRIALEANTLAIFISYAMGNAFSAVTLFVELQHYFKNLVSRLKKKVTDFMYVAIELLIVVGRAIKQLMSRIPIYKRTLLRYG